MTSTTEDNDLKLEFRNTFNVTLVDHMGDDLRAVAAARVSTAADDNARGAERLIKYLLRNGHWSPFEHTYFTFRSEIPIFLARQIMRHQTHRFNEHSMRYSPAIPAVYVPKQYAGQSDTMKQGRAEPLDGNLNSWLLDSTKTFYQQAWDQYHWLLTANNVSREQARDVLPVAFYTVLYSTMNLRSLLHFIDDRSDSTAQTEAQVYAKQVEELVHPIVPLTIDAWRMKEWL